MNQSNRFPLYNNINMFHIYTRTFSILRHIIYQIVKNILMKFNLLRYFSKFDLMYKVNHLQHLNTNYTYTHLRIIIFRYHKMKIRIRRYFQLPNNQCSIKYIQLYCLLMNIEIFLFYILQYIIYQMFLRAAIIHQFHYILHLNSHYFKYNINHNFHTYYNMHPFHVNTNYINIILHTCLFFNRNTTIFLIIH